MKLGSTLIMLGLGAVVSSSAASTIGGPASKIKASVAHRKKTQSSLNSLSPSRSPSREEHSNELLPLSSHATHISPRHVPRGGDTMQQMKIAFYFGLWYALNVIYNILNKKLLNIIPAPVTVGTIQLGIGAAYAALLWFTGIRSKPRLTPKGKEICLKVGVYHGSGQLFSMVSLGAGPVSFTHIVKALEPFFSALISGIFFGKWMKPQVYATLLPVVGGVGAVVSKTGMVNYIGENMNSVNLFALVTTASFFLCIPAAILSEKTKLLDLWSAATTGENAVITSAELTKSVIISGLFHYLNNEVMYLALSNVHPVTLAVGNTMKRVFIMVASVLVFHNPVSMQAGIGSAIGISGVLLYSLTKQYYEKLEAAAVAAAAELEAAQPKGRRGRGRK